MSGETKHWIDSDTSINVINIWDVGSKYDIGDQVYDNSITWIAVIRDGKRTDEKGITLKKLE